MSDGVVLRANVYLPSTTGRYPTVLTATGYNKDAANPTGQDCSSSQGI
jgi:predicted acyl esterase